MFHRSSFKTTAVSPRSWKFTEDLVALLREEIYGSGAGTRRVEDEHLFQIALAIIMSGAIE